MKLGIISDIHSNIVAFQACMDLLLEKGCREFVFLGDFVSDTSYTVETMEYLYDILEAYPVSLLRGNREEYMLEQREVVLGRKEGRKWKKNSASGNLLFTYERLTERDLDFFEKLPITFRYEKSGFPAITFCHGSPNNSRELMQLDGENTKQWLERIDTDYLIAAHTHHPGCKKIGNKYYMNTGSCGVAIGKSGLAECMILESVETPEGGKWVPEFLDVPFDHKKVVKDIFTSGLYDSAPWFINANILVLTTGIDHCAELVNLAKAMSAEAAEPQKQEQWPDIAEEYFQKAAEQLGIPDYKRMDNGI